MHKILLIEDDKTLAQSISDFFDPLLYQITIFHDGLLGYQNARKCIYDLIILDVTLPNKNGLVIASQLRANHIETPILIISTRNLVDDIVNGFCYGIDGYVTKPFNLRELRSRCLALLKRPTHSTLTKLKLGDLKMNLSDMKVMRDKFRLILRKKEFSILKYFLENPKRVITKDELVDNIWMGGSCDCSQNNLDVHISGLRNKIDKGFKTKLLHTIHGIGYSLYAENEK